MKAVHWLLIGCRVLALSCGLTFLAAGCGGGATTTDGGQTDQQKMQMLQDSKNAMEAGSKTAKAKK